MSEIRIIKKYPNRRLYDTEVSKYITLEDVRQLVLEGVDFCVKDVKSNEDLTRAILLQIISEQEHGGEPMFSTDMLTHIIRFYGDSMQTVASDYLRKSLEMFVQQQKHFQKNLTDAVTTNPINTMTEMTERNLKLWREVQDNFFRAASNKSGNDSDQSD
ncbi:MAG: polyhydroxyalkanoate synthesis repressor PhaR [Gammaproteobacteria bacterium]|nr:polyhydroxyalkanoate synthesis repressor PhaR [Gammaproteobacteria bacterium]